MIKLVKLIMQRLTLYSVWAHGTMFVPPFQGKVIQMFKEVLRCIQLDCGLELDTKKEVLERSIRRLKVLFLHDLLGSKHLFWISSSPFSFPFTALLSSMAQGYLPFHFCPWKAQKDQGGVQRMSGGYDSSLGRGFASLMVCPSSPGQERSQAQDQEHALVDLC